MKDDFNLEGVMLFFLALLVSSIGFSKHYFPDEDVINQTINIFVAYLFFLFFFFYNSHNCTIIRY